MNYFHGLLTGWLGPIILASVLVFVLLICGYIVRRRRIRSIQKLISEEKHTSIEKNKPPSTKQFDSESIVSTIKAEQTRRDLLDKKIQKRFTELQDSTLSKPPQSVNPNDLNCQIESFRVSINRQEKKISALSDILTLQNEKLDSLETENQVLRGLVD